MSGVTGHEYMGLARPTVLPSTNALARATERNINELNNRVIKTSRFTE
jgi:hypothetical protein